jgi:hypothetical protein
MYSYVQWNSFFRGQCLCLSLSTHKQCILPKSNTYIAMFSLKPLHVPRRDSNPGLLPLRLIQCPLRHAARATVEQLQYTPTLEFYRYTFLHCSLSSKYRELFSLYVGSTRYPAPSISYFTLTGVTIRICHFS